MSKPQGVGGTWMLLHLAACGLMGAGGACAPADAGGANSSTAIAGTASLRASSAPPALGAGLRFGRGADLRRAADAAALRFRAGARGQLSAAGARHRLQIRNGVVQVSRVLAPAEQRQRLLAGLGAAAVAPPALELETLSIARAGYQCLDGAPAPAVVDGDGRARRAFATCGERWSNGAQSGEVVFDFAQRPAGRGDLVVALRAQIGAAEQPMLVEADAEGLRLAAPGGGERFRFGHATWVDAAGISTAVPARWRGGRIVLTVPAEIVDGSRYPAVLDPIVGPDLGTDRPILQPSSTGVEPQIASDGSDFLVTFSNLQSNFAVRVGAGGEVLDLSWLDFSAPGFQQVDPVVAFGGGRYLVAWWQFDTTTSTVWGRLVNPDGTLVGADNFRIASGEGVDVSVAWNGQSFVVAWFGLNPTPGVRLAMVGADGTVASERAVSPTARSFEPRIGAGLTTSVIAWIEPDVANSSISRIGATRIAQDGTVLDPGGIVVDGSAVSQREPAVASDGHRFLVTWNRDSATIQGALIDESGSVAVPTFPISRSPSSASKPAAAFGAGEYLVAWQVFDPNNDSFVSGASISPGGLVQGAADTRLGGVRARAGVDPTGLAWNGTHFLLAYDGERDLPSGLSLSGIDGSLIGPDLSIAADALAFSKIPNQQFSPHAAWDGLDYIVSWTDQRDPFPSGDARAVRISSAGVVRDPSGIALTAPLAAGNHDLASDGARRSLVTWTTSTGRGVVRALAANGTLGPIRTLVPGTLASNPLLASNGDGFLSVFARTNAAGTRTDLVGTFIAASGNPGPLFTIRRGIDGVDTLVSAAANYLVELFEGGLAKLVTVDGNGRVSAPTPAPASVLFGMVAANSNRNTLLAWVTTDGQIQAQLFARGGLRGPVLSIAPSSDSFPPTVAFDGRRYWIVWAADRDSERPMIRGVETTGALGEVSMLFDDACEAPELASNGAQQMLMTCFHFPHNRAPFRISTRLVDTSSTTPAAAAAAPLSAAAGAE